MRNFILASTVAAMSCLIATMGQSEDKVGKVATGETRTVTIAKNATGETSLPENTFALTILGFQPGSVSSEVVVRDLVSGKEVARLGIFPNEPFEATDGGRKTMLFKAPPGLKLGAGTKLVVGVVPVDPTATVAGKSVVDIGGVTQ